ELKHVYGGDWDALKRDKLPQGGHWPETIAEIEARGVPKAEQTGRMYEVNIRANPDEFLDWDVGLPRQGAKVKEALDAAGIRQEMPNASGRAIYEALVD